VKDKTAVRNLAENKPGKSTKKKSRMRVGQKNRAYFWEKKIVFFGTSVKVRPGRVCFCKLTRKSPRRGEGKVLFLGEENKGKHVIRVTTREKFKEKK